MLFEPTNYAELDALVQLAAQRATGYLEANHLSLAPNGHVPPSFSQTYEYLSGMTNRAVQNYAACREKAPASTPDSEVTGWETDQLLFDVEVSGVGRNSEAVTVTILLRVI